MTKNDLMNSTSLVSTAESMWAANLSVFAVEVKADGTLIFPKDWQRFCDNPLSREQQQAQRQKLLNGSNSLFLACGRVFDGKRLICVDVDDDRLVPVATTTLGPVVCARFGSKGIGIFLWVDANDEFFKKKKVIKLSDGDLGIELLTRLTGTFTPPSVHRATRQLYKWLEGNLASDLFNLPTMPRARWELLAAVVSSPEALTLLNGDATHDAMRDLCAKIVRFSDDDDFLVEVVQSVFSPSYTGDNNADKEIARTLKSAREKGFDRPSSGGMPPETIRRLEEFNERVCVVKVGGKTVILEKAHDFELNRDAYIFQSVTDFKNFHLDELVEVPGKKGGVELKPIGHVWITWRNRAKALAVVLLPDREPGLVPVTGGNIYNLWTGFRVEPAAGEWPKIQYHFKEVICDGNEAYYFYFFCWLANCMQNPGHQGEVAIVLKGGRGTGKSTVGRMLELIFGKHYFHAASSGQVAGRFNPHLRDTVLLFGDEAFFAGDKKNEGTLKSMITDDIIAVEAKFVDVTQVKNHLHIIMATNEDWAVPAGLDERRFFVLQVSEKHKQDHPYFEALNDAIKGELPAMLHSLLTHDLSDFRVRAVPQTDALNYQKERSLGSVEDWMLKVLMDGHQTAELFEWSEWVQTSLLYDEYVAYTKVKNGYPVPYNSFSKRVQALVEAERVKRTHGATGGRVGALAFDSLAVCRERFDEVLGFQTEWPEDDDLDESKVKF